MKGGNGRPGAWENSQLHCYPPVVGKKDESCVLVCRKGDRRIQSCVDTKNLPERRGRKGKKKRDGLEFGCYQLQPHLERKAKALITLRNWFHPGLTGLFHKDWQLRVERYEA